MPNKLFVFITEIRFVGYFIFTVRKQLFVQGYKIIVRHACNIIRNDLIRLLVKIILAVIIFSCFLESLTSLVQFRIPDFEELGLTNTNTENFIHSLNLKISDNDDPKNFAIVPIMTLSHISLMFIDLRKKAERIIISGISL